MRNRICQFLLVDLDVSTEKTHILPFLNIFPPLHVQCWLTSKPEYLQDSMIPVWLLIHISIGSHSTVLFFTLPRSAELHDGFSFCGVLIGTVYTPLEREFSLSLEGYIPPLWTFKPHPTPLQTEPHTHFWSTALHTVWAPEHCWLVSFALVMWKWKYSNLISVPLRGLFSVYYRWLSLSFSCIFFFSFWKSEEQLYIKRPRSLHDTHTKKNPSSSSFCVHSSHSCSHPKNTNTNTGRLSSPGRRRSRPCGGRVCVSAASGTVWHDRSCREWQRWAPRLLPSPNLSHNYTHFSLHNKKRLDNPQMRCDLNW